MTRRVDERLVLGLGLVVLVVAGIRPPGGWGAVAVLPIAAVVPGSVLQRAYLPQLGVRAWATWSLRIAVSLGWWALVGVATAAARVPVVSGWTTAVAAVPLAAVLVAAPGAARAGRVGSREVVAGLVSLGVAVAVAVVGRGLVAVAGAAGDGAAPTVAFADPALPFALGASGGTGTVTVVVANPGGTARRVVVGATVGVAVPWDVVATDLTAHTSRRITLTGAIAACQERQQVTVTLVATGGSGAGVSGATGEGGPSVTTSVPGTPEAPSCAVSS